MTVAFASSQADGLFRYGFSIETRGYFLETLDAHKSSKDIGG